MRRDQSSRRSGLLLVAAGASLWGVDTVLRTPLTDGLSSSVIVFYEHVLLTIAFAPYLIIKRRRLAGLRASSWWCSLWIGWGGSALGTICYTQAVKLGNPTSVVFLQKLQPLIAVVLAGWWLGEREPLRARFWVRAGTALLGAYLISFGASPAWGAFSNTEWAPALWAVGAAAIWGSCTVVGRYALPDLSPILLTALRVVSALPLLGLLALSSKSTAGIPMPGSDQWARLALMALIPGFLALLIYYRGLARTPASLATFGELCFPAAAAVLNWLFLGTAISIAQGLGVVVLWLAVLWPRREGFARRA